MCDRCHEISRRQVLTGALGLGAALLAGCNDPPRNELPTGYLNTVSDEFGGQVRIDPKTIVIPPKQQVQASDYGSIMPRSAWTSSPLTLKNGSPMGAITKLTIHHSGDGKMFDPATPAEVARHLQIVLQAHLQRGMIDIGYHFAVDPQGRAWQLRSLSYEGQHVRMSATGFRNNEHNIGVVALGDFNLQTVTPQQSARLFELVRTLMTRHALKPTDVYAHGEIVQTDCPGRVLKPAVVDARRRNFQS